MRTIAIYFFALLLLLPFQAVAEGGHGHGHEDEHGHGHEEAEVDLRVQRFMSHGVRLSTVQSGDISERVRLTGQLAPDENRVAHIIPRFPGIIREVRKNLGDRVEKNDVVAIIESNQSLQPYEIRSLISGVVIERHATLGEFVSGEQAIFEVADFSTLYANLFVFPTDARDVRVGQKVFLKLNSSKVLRESQISFISPIVEATTQSRVARAVIQNSDQGLEPGSYVNAEVVVSEKRAAQTVETSAIQYLKNEAVVFVVEDGVFEPRKVTLGRKDELRSEILSGVELGNEYAVGETFLIKAEIGKGEAEHSH